MTFSNKINNLSEGQSGSRGFWADFIEGIRNFISFDKEDDENIGLLKYQKTHSYEAVKSTTQATQPYNITSNFYSLESSPCEIQTPTYPAGKL